jgi:hypothetical protein
VARPENERERERDRRDLTALADGSLRGRRRARLEARLAASPELREELERQTRAVAAIRSVELSAPAGLRARVVAERVGARRPARSRRLALGAALAGAVAAAALAAVLALPGSAGPSVVEAAELASRPATDAAPAPDPATPRELEARAEGLAFPNWAETLGWRATGVRRDEIEGRSATTVFYERGGRMVGYTIVSGEWIEPPEGARPAERAGTKLWHLDDRGRPIVTWERDGRTCVLSGEDVPVRVLLGLAAW